MNIADIAEPEPNEPSPEDIDEMWNMWLDGGSVNFIHTFKFPEFSRRLIQKILSGPIPDRYKGDIRATGYHYVCLPLTGEHPLVIILAPVRIKNRDWAKAVNAVSRAATGEFGYGIPKRYSIPADIIEPDVAARMINNRGTPAWKINQDGSLTRLQRV